MKILITTDLYTTNTNGVVTSVNNLYEELKKKGHDVRIFTFSGTMRSHKEGDVYYLRSMPIGVYPDARMPLTYYHRFVKELVKWQPDIIHSQCEFFSYQYALHISKHADAPIVHTCHTLYEQYVTYISPSRRIGKKLIKTFTKRRLKKVDDIVAPTHKVEDALLGYGVRKNIVVVPSGINLEQHKVRLPIEERREKRRALGYDDGHLVLLNLGRLGTEKRVDELLDFFSKAIEKHGQIRFLIVGDGPARADLERQVAALGIGGYVHFTGMVDPSTVQEYYQLGDIFVSASTSEAQGLTYIEAAANGLPLLCRNDPCLNDVIVQGENGFSYTDEEDFLEKIDKIISEPDWCEKAAKRSEEISSTFDKVTFGDSIEEVYESVLAARKKYSMEEYQK